MIFQLYRRIKWEDGVPDTEVSERASWKRFSSLERSQLRWAGHIFRMEDSRIPKQLLYSELADGSRKRGRPKLRYKDTLKASLKDCHIDPETLEQSASDRPAWRHQVWKGANSYEKNHIAKKKEQRRRESNFAHPPCSWLNPILTNPSLSCSNQLSSLSFSFIYRLVLTIM